MENYVFWLDVPVDDLEGVDFVDCIADLLHYGSYSDFGEGL